MAYIDGFVAAVPAAHKQRYIEHARKAGAMFREFGATRLVESWGDDVPKGEVTDFAGAVAAEGDEVVVFGWFEFPSKQVRDAAQQRMQSDPRMATMGAGMPFDGKRMIFGGFDTIVDAVADSGGTNRGTYVAGFLVAVPETGKDAYLDMAQKGAAVFLEHGAVRVVEAWEDDVPSGTLTDMRRAVKAIQSEKVVFSWVEWPSKAVRDSGMEKVMKDLRMHMDGAPMPFDGKRMVYGGFAVIVEG